MRDRSLSAPTRRVSESSELGHGVILINGPVSHAGPTLRPVLSPRALSLSGRGLRRRGSDCWIRTTRRFEARWCRCRLDGHGIARLDLKGLARARVRRVHDATAKTVMEAARADGLQIGCSAAHVVGSGWRQVQHAHELHVSRSPCCRQDYRGMMDRWDGGLEEMLDKEEKQK